MAELVEIKVPADVAAWYQRFVQQHWYGGLTIHFKSGTPQYIEPKISHKIDVTE